MTIDMATYQYSDGLKKLLDGEEHIYSDNLTGLLGFSNLHKIEVTEDRLRDCLPALRSKIAFYRVYPDIFIDDIKGPDSIFKFYTYQRVFLRAVMRHRYVYATFPRAYSKSFLTMMSLILKCILYPNLQCSVTTGGKEQAASITIAKVEEICKLIPALNNEIDWSRGASKKSRDQVKYIFKNGSYIDILAARESSRGQRRNAIVIEEAILMDGDILHEVIVPTTNVDRLLPDGSRDPKEIANKSQVYITTAGWKSTFAYDQMIDTFINAIVNPEEYCILGGTFDTPVKEGLLEEDFVTKLQIEGTFNESSFDREYRSVWGGDSEGAFFSAEAFDKCRELLLPEWEYSERSSKTSYYVLGVDVGRIKCTTEVAVIKVIPQIQGPSIKSFVNFYSFQAEDFEQQAIKVKKLFFKYKARSAVIDANGLGVGFIDFMTKAQIDPETNEVLQPFGVEGGTNAEALEQYKNIKGENVLKNAMYLIKANSPIDTEAYSYIQTQLLSKKLRFLIDEKEAKIKLMETKVGQKMNPEDRNFRIQPYVLTSILKDEMQNLKEENEGVNIKLKQISRGIPKDRFSAVEYGLYYIKKQEDGKRRKRIDVSKLALFN